MSKKYLFIITAFIMFIGITGCALTNQKTSDKNTSEVKEKSPSNSITNENKKVAVVYFSATGTTKSVAKTLSRETGGDLIEIVPKEKYTSEDLDWNNKKSRTSVECNDSASRPEIASKIDVSDYNIIYLGYPIWWGDVPHIILTFMDTHVLDDKTVIPFCTSGGTGIDESESTLKKYNKNVKWINGKRLDNDEDEIKSWINTLKY